MSIISFHTNPSLGDTEPLMIQYPSGDLIKHTRDGNLIELQKFRHLGQRWNILDEKLNSLLHIAAKKGHKLIVEFLLSIKELDPKHLNMKGLSALHIAARDGQDEIVTLLLKHIDIDSRSSDRVTPLIIAAWKGRTSTVKLLLENKADSRLACNAGYTALINACISKNIDTVLELLKNEYTSINHQSKSGSTAFLLAARLGCDKIVACLLEHGATPNIITNSGVTANIEAIKSGSKSTLSLVKKQCPELQKYSREYCSRKLLAHIFQISGMSKLILSTELLPKKEYSLDLEGLYPAFGWSKISKYTTRYLHMNSGKSAKSWAIISDLFTSEITPNSLPVTLLLRYKNKKPIVIETGLEDHTAYIILWDRYLIICETGGYLKRTIQIHHINSERIDELFINKVQQLVQKNKKEFLKFWATKIPLAPSTEKTGWQDYNPILISQNNELAIALWLAYKLQFLRY